MRCRNRRASVCPSCAYLYQGDVYHLVRAGLEGGKGIPDSVTGHARASACFARHGDDDPLVGTPLCGDCHDYGGAVVWQASVGKLWQRFTTYLPRHLALLTGRMRADVTAVVRFSFVKIVEYQRRGLVHVHTVIRADGISDQTDDDGVPVTVAPPQWVTAVLLARAVRAAAEAVRVSIDGGSAGSWVLGWGAELDVHDLTSRQGEDAGKVAAYVAKYATKSTEVTGWDSTGRQGTPRAVHAGAMAGAAFALAEVPQLAGLKLGRWVKELAYRGHVSSMSRRHSTTLGALRQARADHRREAAREAAGRTGPDVESGGSVVESSWELVGFGYSPGQAFLTSSVARDVEVNRAAAREAGAARPGWLVGGQAHGEARDASQRGARVASPRQAPPVGGDAVGS